MFGVRVLVGVAFRGCPVVAVIKNMMKANGALNAMMSGSGPTVFGIFSDYAKAKRAFQIINANPQVKQSYLTSVYNNRR
ncbi:hypothetical protein CG709_11590 [Lachnotalea glycerini]|nr:hypothetical protein CG709_11590 [Lachnotalea glycerini]